MRSTLLPAALLIFNSSPASAQNAFDVASITPVPSSRAGGEGSGREHISWTPTSVTLENASLSGCIEWAYEVRSYQIDGPAWIIGIRYDIVAKTEHPASLARLRLMLQALLAERFQLALHRMAKSIPVFELVVNKGGPKLGAAGADASAGMRVVNGRFVFRRFSMPELAGLLSELAGVDRPVVDKTGIAGVFDFSLPAIPHAPNDGEAVWLFSALEEQLGLALKPAKGSVEMLAIDHAERPSAN